MINWIRDLFVADGQRKLIAFFCALTIYMLVNNSITTTVTLSDVRVHVVGLSQDATVEGLLPSGYLSQGVTLTLKGRRSVLESLEPGAVEIKLNASNREGQWIAHIGKNNLASLNPDIDLLHNITEVTHSELIMKMSRFITVKVPVTIASPFGEPPQGYQYLDVWPQKFYHTISGPEEQVEKLQTQGLRLRFDLSKISTQELDSLSPPRQGLFDDEVYYYVASKHKRIAIPFHNNALEEINDPDAQFLRIEFLRKGALSLGQMLPVRPYFSIRYAETLNPETFSLMTNEMIVKKEGLMCLTTPLFVRNVSRKFLNVVHNYLELAIVVAPPLVQEQLSWSVQFTDPKELEDRYVAELLSVSVEEEEEVGDLDGLREGYLRNRFREYMRSIELVKENGEPLSLDIRLKGSNIVVKEASLKP